jgi:hypothetical protein
MRVNTPAVTSSMRVRQDTFEPKRTRYPTVSPTASPSVAAMRAAAARAASRRGSSTMIFRSRAQTSAASTNGTRVVFPAPGGATSTATSPARKTAVSSGSAASIGRGGANIIRIFVMSRVEPTSSAQRWLACGLRPSLSVDN